MSPPSEFQREPGDYRPVSSVTPRTTPPTVTCTCLRYTSVSEVASDAYLLCKVHVRRTYIRKACFCAGVPIPCRRSGGGSSLEGAGKGRLWRKGSRKEVDRGTQ